MGSGSQNVSMPSTSTSLTLYGGFRSNPFTMSEVLVGGNPFQAQWNSMHGSFPSHEMSSRGNPFLIQSNPMQVGFQLQGGFIGGNPYFLFGNQICAIFLLFNQNQGFTQGSGSSAKSSWKPSAILNL
jgi:hypothetical protein